MKKVYEKPGIYVESFELSQSVAAGCGAYNPQGTLGKPLHDTKETCGWGDEVVSWWLDGVNTCKISLGTDATTGVVCYNNPGPGVTIFAS